MTTNRSISIFEMKTQTDASNYNRFSLFSDAPDAPGQRIQDSSATTNYAFIYPTLVNFPTSCQPIKINA